MVKQLHVSYEISNIYVQLKKILFIKKIFTKFNNKNYHFYITTCISN